MREDYKEAEDEESETELSSADENKNHQEKSTKFTTPCTDDNNIIFIKDLIESRKDNIIYFINDSGKPLDNAATNLIDNGKIEIYPTYEPNTINIQSVKQTKYYGICLKTNEAIITIINNLKRLLNELTNSLINSK